MSDIDEDNDAPDFSEEMGEEVPVADKISPLMQQILTLRDRIKILDDESKDLKVEKATLENSLMELMSNAGLTQTGTTFGTATMKSSQKIAIEDWETLLAYVIATDSTDILQKRISTTAVAARLNADEEVPGITVFPIFTVSIRKK